MILTCCLLVLTGCQAKTDKTSNQQPAPHPQQTTDQPTSHPTPKDWQPKPVSIRIYPSTRFVEQDGKPILEARIELFDEMGDSVKSSGSIRLELFAIGEDERRTVGARLYRWDINQTTIDDQRRYYDPIIRGYVYRLELDDVELTRRPTLLRVVFQPTQGPRLVTEDRVRTDW